MKRLKSETKNLEPKRATWNNLNIFIYFSRKTVLTLKPGQFLHNFESKLATWNNLNIYFSSLEKNCADLENWSVVALL
jgi:hypothetical protein